ncbi:MAG: DNA replication/repair protein RecF [Pseudomonadota bacterium]
MVKAAAPIAGTGGTVRLRRLGMTDFRSYAMASLELDGRPVAISGPNGAGKTNILEALSLLGPGRGLRGARLGELARVEGAGGWAVSAKIDDGEDERVLGVGALAEAPDRRTCRIDGNAASGPSAFAPLIRFIWLTPAQDRLFMEGAGERRKFLDRMIAAHDGGYARIASTYEQALRQRQKLLDAGSRDAAWLGAVEQQIAQAGIAIADARRAMAATLMAADVVADPSAGEQCALFPAADLALAGDLEAALDSRPAAEVEEEFASTLAANRYRDREAGRALTGPHRTDLVVTHRKKGRPARLCSTGEQKALLIGLVLANARALAHQRAASSTPVPLVLLLDEVAAHLDEGRRAALFDILDGLGFQVFMTGTDKSLFSAWGDRAQFLTVQDGSISNVSG